MAVLEIQANGDAAVSKEAIVNAGQSLEDPLMRVSQGSYPKFGLQQRKKRTIRPKILCLHPPTHSRTVSKSVRGVCPDPECASL